MAAGNHDGDVTSALAGNLLQYCSNRLGNMKLDLKRLFARSMTGGFELAEAPAQPAPSSARSARQQTMFVILAGILAIIGAVAGAYYFAMRPVTLRIAVGPANSDDLKVVQALTQAFAQKHGYVRLRPIQTDGATESAKALENGSVDLAIIRGDLDVPKNAQAVATLRKNVAVLWVPPAAKGKGKKAGPKITKVAQLAGHRVGVVGRTPANVNLLKVILQQYGVDPAKVEIVQFPVSEIAEAIRSQKADVYLAAGPVNSKITADAIAASTRDGGPPKFLAIDSAEAIDHHAIMKAKLEAFLDGAGQTLIDYPDSDTSFPARYARAIAYYKETETDRALCLLVDASASMGYRGKQAPAAKMASAVRRVRDKGVIFQAAGWGSRSASARYIGACSSSVAGQTSTSIVPYRMARAFSSTSA